MIIHDIVHTHFNQTGDRLDCLPPMIFTRIPGLIILAGENESFSGSFLDMLKQGSHRGKSIKIKPDGIYQLERHDRDLTQFNMLEIERRYENQSSDGFTNTTITWLNWMPHIRILNIDTELLLQLIVNNINIDRFSSLEVLIIRQTKNCTIAEPLTIVTRTGVSSSLCTVHLQHYGADSQFTTDDPLLVIHQICHNICQLK